MPCDVFVADNSRHKGPQRTIEAICKQFGAYYSRLEIEEGDYSRHHAFALDWAYNSLRRSYKQMLILDHDCIPFAYTDLPQVIKRNAFIGVEQVVNGTLYLHPGFLWVNLDIVKEPLNFLPSPGLDTGGQLAALIAKYGYLNAAYEQDSKLGFEVFEDSFLHIVKGSNWNKDAGHAERLEKILKVLKRKENGNVERY